MVSKSILLAAIHLAQGVVWLTLYVYLVGRLADFLTRVEIKRRLEQLTGLLLIGLGVRLAWERR